MHWILFSKSMAMGMGIIKLHSNKQPFEFLKYKMNIE